MNTKINDKIFEKFPILESDRLSYREFKPSDAPDIFYLRSNEQVMAYMDTEKQQAIIESEILIDKIQESFKEKAGINWAIIEKSTNTFIGYISYWRLITEHCRAEIGYALKPEFWGKGFMTEAMDRIIKFGFNDLKIHSIEANVNPQNKVSITLLEKIGFKKEAHFRENYLFKNQFLDSCIYSLLETDVS